MPIYTIYDFNMDFKINNFSKGIHNLIDPELIPSSASQSSENWFTQDGKQILIGGKLLVGDELGAGKIKSLHFGYKVDGTKVLYRKTVDKIQYLNGNTWVDVITGLTDTDYSFANYSSLSGAFTFINGTGGYWKIVNANPTSPIQIYEATKNYHGKILIDRGRTVLWDRTTDKTGLYISWIDRQDSTVYTTITAEAIGASGSQTYTGTLAFKAGDTKRNCFAVSFSGTVAGGTETFSDNFLGILTGSLGGSGTINYATGAYSVTFSATTTGAVTATYKYENSNIKGITDFTKSATRLAGEGDIFRQDESGDAILNVLIGIDNAYYSLKSQSVFRLNIDITDLSSTNLLYRKDIGISSWRSAVATNRGVLFMDTANPTKPQLTILQRNELAVEITPYVLMSHFDFSKYTYDECNFDTFDRYIIIACKTLEATVNDTILLCNISTGTVDVLNYSCQVSAKSTGSYYIGSSITQNVYKLFSGNDDDGNVINNIWTGKDEIYQKESLKKFKRLRLKGLIDTNQYYEVYIDYDKAGKILVGTVNGSDSFMDKGTVGAVGESLVGEINIGGVISNASSYLCELKVKTPKFRKRTISIIAKGIGYVDFQMIQDRKIQLFENKLPKRNRVKKV